MYKIITMDSAAHALLNKALGRAADMRKLREALNVDEAIYYYQVVAGEYDLQKFEQLVDAGWEVNLCLGRSVDVKHADTAQRIESATLAAEIGGIVGEHGDNVELYMGVSYFANAGVIAQLRKNNPNTILGIVAPLDYISPDWHTIVDEIIDSSRLAI